MSTTASRVSSLSASVVANPEVFSQGLSESMTIFFLSRQIIMAQAYLTNLLDVGVGHCNRAKC